MSAKNASRALPEVTSPRRPRTRVLFVHVARSLQQRPGPLTRTSARPSVDQARGHVTDWKRVEPVTWVIIRAAMPADNVFPVSLDVGHCREELHPSSTAKHIVLLAKPRKQAWNRAFLVLRDTSKIKLQPTIAINVQTKQQLPSIPPLLLQIALVLILLR